MIIKTKGDSSPRGKQRIYLIGDERDLAAYALGQEKDSLCNRIFDIVSCAICYAQPGEETETFLELLQNPQKVQMVTAVITSRFFEHEASMKALRYAVEHHIPVLPILEEEGIEYRFNQLCGDLQCLNPNRQERTEIAYEEKLRSFLEKTLVDEHTAEQVREAFDAYIFLSYRKKDREYVQELMHLIHGNSFCRDVAIWYDEFLVPGEDFNDAIRGAICKSNLFVLAVTPNLINEKNYVQEIEYPFARNEQKSRMAVEMLSTDQQRLSELYPDLPRCIHPEKAADLEDELWNALKDHVRMNNKNTPSQCYLMGLAYLNGIDVEVDYERAVQLITQAAEYGSADAVEKLIHMYEKGIGVHRDYEAALRWQRRLIDCYNNAKSPLEALKLTLAVYNYAAGFSRLGRKQEARKYYESTLALGREAMESRTEGREMFQRILTSCCYQLSEICDELGERDASAEYLRMAEEFHSALAGTDYVTADKGRSAQQLLQEIQMVCKKGDLVAQQGQYEVAKECYMQAYRMALELENNLDGVEEQDQLIYRNARVVVCIGLARLSEGTRCDQYYEEALGLLDQLSAVYPDDLALKKNRYACLINLGDVLQYRGDYDRAYSYIESALLLAREIAELSETVDSYLDLLTAQVRYGEIRYEKGAGFAVLAPILADATEVAQLLEGKTDAAVYHRAVYGIKRLYGFVYAMLPNTQGLAVKFMSEAVAAAEALVQQKNSVENRECLAGSYEEYIRIDESPMRLRAMAMLIKVLLDLADDYPETVRYRELASTYWMELEDQNRMHREETARILMKVQNGGFVEDKEIRRAEAVWKYLVDLEPYIDYIRNAMKTE